MRRFRELTDEQAAMLLSTRKAHRQYTEGVVMGAAGMNLFRAVPPSTVLALAATERHEKAERADVMAARGVVGGRGGEGGGGADRRRAGHRVSGRRRGRRPGRPAARRPSRVCRAAGGGRLDRAGGAGAGDGRPGGGDGGGAARAVRGLHGVRGGGPVRVDLPRPALRAAGDDVRGDDAPGAPLRADGGGDGARGTRLPVDGGPRRAGAARCGVAARGRGALRGRDVREGRRRAAGDPGRDAAPGRGARLLRGRGVRVGDRGGCVSQLAGSVPGLDFVCPPPVLPMPYYASVVDPLWRFGEPGMVAAAQDVAAHPPLGRGLREPSAAGALEWGTLFPLGGWMDSGHDYRNAANVAQRAAFVATNRTFGLPAPGGANLHVRAGDGRAAAARRCRCRTIRRRGRSTSAARPRSGRCRSRRSARCRTCRAAGARRGSGSWPRCRSRTGVPASPLPRAAVRHPRAQRHVPLRRLGDDVAAARRGARAADSSSGARCCRTWRAATYSQRRERPGTVPFAGTRRSTPTGRCFTDPLIGRMNKDGGYAWQLWREYECCANPCVVRVAGPLQDRRTEDAARRLRAMRRRRCGRAPYGPARRRWGRVTLKEGAGRAFCGGVRGDAAARARVVGAAGGGAALRGRRSRSATLRSTRWAARCRSARSADSRGGRWTCPCRTGGPATSSAAASTSARRSATSLATRGARPGR